MDKQTSNTPATSSETAGSGGVGATMVGGAIAVVVIVVALAVGTYALFRMDSWDAGAAHTSASFDLDLTSHADVPAELLAYVEAGRRDVALEHPVAIASDEQGTTFVAGDEAIEVLQPDGTSQTLPLDFKPTCLAVAPDPGNGARLYVGAGQYVVVLDRKGNVLQQWPASSDKSMLTAIAIGGGSVFVADAGQRVVLRYDPDGELQGTIGESDPGREMPGFVIPSPYFDLVVGADELLYVVNPGMRRVEAYNFDGDLQSFWGRAGSSLPDFFGCCNPAHLALLPDGRFVTSEKGIPRVKIYSPAGEMQQVVAAPKQLGVPASALGDARGAQKERVFDVAVDENGMVLVLDARRRQVVSYKPRGLESESES